MPIDTDAIAVPAEPAADTPPATDPNEQEDAAAEVESALAAGNPPSAVVRSAMPMGVDIQETPAD